MRRAGFQLVQRGADLADFTARAGRGDFGQRRATHDQRAGKHQWLILTARSRSRIRSPHRFAHRHRLACQQGFVRRQVCRLQKPCVCRHPVALGQHDHIAAHHIRARDAQPLAPAQHQRARAGQIAQRIEHPFGSRLLHCRDADRHARKGQQDDGFGPAAQ